MTTEATETYDQLDSASTLQATDLLAVERTPGAPLLKATVQALMDWLQANGVGAVAAASAIAAQGAAEAAEGVAVVQAGVATAQAALAQAAATIIASTLVARGDWSSAVNVTDAAGNILIEISPSKVNHPDINTIRGQAALAAGGIGALQSIVGTASAWLAGFAVTDQAGNKLIEIGPATINHPDINSIRAQLATLSAVGARQNRLNNAFAFVGDSRLAMIFADPAQRTKCACHWFNEANANPAIGQAMRIAYNGAVSGYRSDQYLSNLSAAISSNAAWLVIWGVVNDLSQGVTAAQAWNGYNGSVGILGAVNLALASGMKVILVSETGSTNLNGNAAALGEINKYNQLAREAAESKPGVHYFDLASVLWDASASGSNLAFRAGYLLNGDATHPGVLGGAAGGQLFASFAQRIGIVPFGQEISGAHEASINGAMQLLANPMFATPSGGSISTGSAITGSVPSGWIGVASGSAGAVFSTAANPNNYGNDLTMACTAGASGDQVSLYQGLNVAGVAGSYPAPQAGDIYQAGVEISVAAGASNLCAAYLTWGMGVSGGGNFGLYDGYAVVDHGLSPSTAYTKVLQTPKMIVPAGAITAWYFTVTALFAGAGSANITLRRTSLRRRFS